MSKSKFFSGQPIFNQLLSFIPTTLIDKVCRETNADYYYKHFKAFDHLVTMLFSSFHQCTSLRELHTGLLANQHRLHHLGIKHTPRRSTISDANRTRPVAFFEKLYHRLYNHHYQAFSPDSRKRKSLVDRLFIVDSTTVSLFSNVMKGAGVIRMDGRKKRGIKAHVLMTAKTELPSFTILTEAAKNDRIIMPQLELLPGSIIAMDRAYVNYKLMKEWTEKEITWVTRVTKSMKIKLLTRNRLKILHKRKGILKDWVIQLGNPLTEEKSPVQTARVISIYDRNTKKKIHLLTNNFTYTPTTIRKLYQKRWAIEMLFKRIKQNSQLNNFLGENKNAISIQLWCTLIKDLLTKIVKDKLTEKGSKKWSFSNLTGFLRLHLYTYIHLMNFLAEPEYALLQHNKGPDQINLQLKLFSF
ncbi:IS4 family transposase [Chitinophaga pinensis]|uniref:Transposase IS4 family protein n=1 Tax=Chitinophaga pinensis (strain ATCC 43595 / DSM 2588 / LMG 13176 / NBRC 15968 / NCIMB 11800 / UQM 2034) TaxID=485918 RepID=A0A979G8Q8_CHIPD|nr:IS4 family transposase [Chitinophaga pinensis]ACU62747.1 transposase IS4 family protein [Chitinophaga pinensis DSM 2588]